MVEDTVYKIALAGLLHDIGKFAERAGFHAEEEFLLSNADLYQPYIKVQNRHTHKHAVYTAAFIDHISKLLPREFNIGQWGLGDSFANLSAGHHKPETPLQWIVAVADRVSSGFDRDQFEGSYNLHAEIKAFKSARLMTLFEQLSIDGDNSEKKIEDFHYRYPLKGFSADKLTPSTIDTSVPGSDDEAVSEYNELLLNFLNDLEHVQHKESIPLWFEHFDSLFMIYASTIPAATVGGIVPDVSLYDHSKSVSAFSSALYLYHAENNSLNVEAVKNYDEEKFLIISGDFYGIQDFIFAEGGRTGKAAAKLLRGRSFYVSLLGELAADMFCRELGLPVSSIVLNAAGKFTILAPNTKSAKDSISRTEEVINNWLVKKFYGEASMGISYISATCEDFITNKFPDLWEKLTKASERKKSSKIDLDKFGGSVSDYLDSFNNEAGICVYCNKRPADIGIKDRSDESLNSCTICSDHKFIGEHLVKKDRLAITVIDADLHGDKLREPIYGKYQLGFTTGNLAGLVKQGQLLKYWDISIADDGSISRDVTAKMISGYVPRYDKSDESDEMLDRLLSGDKSDTKKEELLDAIRDGVPKSFHHISKMALNNEGNTKKFSGIEALGILKADVDNLGLLFSCGMPAKRITLSRIASMSRQLNQFFSVYLPYALKTNERFKDIYTVFAGGDDLFLIGPWNRIVEFSTFMHESFNAYTCGNKDITISAGISINKPGTPVKLLAECSEEALEHSKIAGRNRLPLFEEDVLWADIHKLHEVKEKIEKWIADKTISKSLLYKLNGLMQQADQAEMLKNMDEITIEDMECLKWGSSLRYAVVRNVAGNDVEDVLVAAKWLSEYGCKFKIPLWQVMYEQR